MYNMYQELIAVKTVDQARFFHEEFGCYESGVKKMIW